MDATSDRRALFPPRYSEAAFWPRNLLPRLVAQTGDPRLRPQPSGSRRLSEKLFPLDEEVRSAGRWKHGPNY